MSTRHELQNGRLREVFRDFPSQWCVGARDLTDVASNLMGLHWDNYRSTVTSRGFVPIVRESLLSSSKLGFQTTIWRGLS